jgi:hypothetical protein
LAQGIPKKEESVNCPGCGAEMKNIPAGVSKSTGKPYEAFSACSNKCGWKPSKGGRLVESALPTKHIQPEPTNDLKERTMLMSYAKDIVVALLARDQVIGAPGKETIAIYREFVQELKNPNSVKIDIL